MITSQFLAPADLEPVYGWLEEHEGVRVEVWGLDDDRRAALLAYADGPGDAFGWSNWVTQAYEDPSDILGLFGRIELVVEAKIAAGLNAAFPGLLVAGAAAGATTAVPTTRS